MNHLPSIRQSAIMITIGVMSVLGVMNACSDVTAKLPAGAIDPKFYATPEAAEQMARSARYDFQYALFDFMNDVGRITDELMLDRSDSLVIGVFNLSIVLDQRHLPDETLQRTAVGTAISGIRSYKELQRVRSTTSLARRALAQYAPDSPPALRGEMLAYEGFAEIMLADLYCSGIPLSTVDSNGDYTYRSGSPVRDVYQHAIALFDSAVALSQQDAAILSLARVGKARALLALGRYADADAEVGTVTAGFQFQLPIMRTSGQTTANPTGNPWASPGVRSGMLIANTKGEVGLPFIQSLDPRVRAVRRTPNSITDSVRYPEQRTNLIIASDLEAQLIHAEALFQAGNTNYLSVLNALRTDGTFTLAPNGDTVYNAGTGGMAGLRPLNAPASGSEIDLIMRERAFWLFYTGHRQGDLRRLIRHYDRDIETVYPRGGHPGGVGFFDQYIDVPIPADERYNPYYSGCLGRGE